MSTSDRVYRHEVFRIDNDGTQHPMPAHPIASERLYVYAIRGPDDWETAEQYLVDQHTASGWDPGRYKIVVTVSTETGIHDVVTVARLLPLHPDYAKLPYKRNRDDELLPARAYIHTLVSRYPGATLELIAEHYETFNRHYTACMSTVELTEHTGYQPPQD